ncbi:hypothetical protein HYDPIDRAFT_164801 [Hydnomerulius pinastri MD-312]|nr:hypothetical protein HYDPIDRAFT_164801 [Hydnomerulius pinastri MD-312]
MESTSTTNASQGSSAVKILTVGPAVGSIRDLFSRVKTIDAKHGKFDCVLCVGDFFGPLQEAHAGKDREDEISQLLSGGIEAPLKCYIMQGENPLPESVIEKYAKTGGELCKDVFLLTRLVYPQLPDKSGIMTTAHGLRIACLGGIYNPGIYASSEAPPGFASPFFTTHTVERLLSNTLIKSSKKGKGQDYGSLAAIRDAASTSQLIDILISNDWPACITSHASVPLSSPELESAGCPPLDEIIRKTKPKYHFASGGSPPKFWEREPFVWDDEAGRVSRFISLGAFGGEQGTGKKQRWFYAFSITPSAQPIQRPSNATKNPFLEVISRPQKRGHETTEGENFIFGNVHQTGKRPRTEAQTGEKGKPPPGYKCRRCEGTDVRVPSIKRPSLPAHMAFSTSSTIVPKEQNLLKVTCARSVVFLDTLFATALPGMPWETPEVANRERDMFAMIVRLRTNGRRMARGAKGREGPRRKSDTFRKHLIVSIGTECYVTLPKGQIIPTQSAPDEGHVSCVPGGGHVLIVPITHQPAYNMIPDDIAPPILHETDKYKTALRGLFAKHGAVPVFYEVARLSAKGGHAHVQAVPVPIALQNRIEDAFVKEGRAQGIDFEEDSEGALQACASGARSYFRVDLPDGRKLVHLMKDHVPFSIQFGRQVLVSLLSIPDRMEWKACMLPEEEDKADVTLFKKAFAPFDPSL